MAKGSATAVIGMRGCYISVAWTKQTLVPSPCAAYKYKYRRRTIHLVEEVVVKGGYHCKRGGLLFEGARPRGTAKAAHLTAAKEPRARGQRRRRRRAEKGREGVLSLVRARTHSAPKIIILIDAIRPRDD